MPLLAALGGAVAFLIVYAIAWKNGTNPVRLVLAGVVVSTVFGSVQRALFFFIDNLGVVMSAQTWLSGSLLGTDWAQVRIALPFTVLSLALAFLVTNELDVLLLGEETAESLGMPVEKVRFGVAGIAILSTAAAIAVAGLIGFVGLIVPTWCATSSGTTPATCLPAAWCLARRCWLARTSARASRWTRCSCPSASSQAWSAARTSCT